MFTILEFAVMINRQLTSFSIIGFFPPVYPLFYLRQFRTTVVEMLRNFRLMNGVRTH